MDMIVIGLCVGAAMLYMGLRVWNLMRGKAEVVCGCGKGCAGCSSRQGNAGDCGLHDLRG